jgi:hypothetical protein
MSASSVHHDKNAVGDVSVLSVFLRHLNMGTLALALFVALAVLSATRGNEAEARVWACGTGADPHVTVMPCDTFLQTQWQIHGDKIAVKEFGNKIARNR